MTRKLLAAAIKPPENNNSSAYQVFPLNDQFDSGDEGEDDSDVTIEVDSLSDHGAVEDDWVDADEDDQENEESDEEDDDDEESSGSNHRTHITEAYKEKQTKPKLMPNVVEPTVRDIEALKISLFSTNPQLELEAIRNCRILSCDGSMPIQRFIEHEDLVAVLSTLLQRTEFPEIIIETTWFIINLTCGTRTQIDVLFSTQMIERLILLISSPNPLIQLHSIWALGNLMGGDDYVRDIIFEYNILPTIISIINQLDISQTFEGENRQLLQILSFFLFNNTIRYCESFVEEMILTLLTTFLKFYPLNDEDILAYVTWGLYYLLPNIPPENVDEIFCPVTSTTSTTIANSKHNNNNIIEDDHDAEIDTDNENNNQSLPLPPPPPPQGNGNPNNNNNIQDNEQNNNNNQLHFPFVLPRMVALLSLDTPRITIPALLFVGTIIENHYDDDDGDEEDQGGANGNGSLFTQLLAIHPFERFKEMLQAGINRVYPTEEPLPTTIAAGETKDIENNTDIPPIITPDHSSVALIEEMLGGILWVIANLTSHSNHIQLIFDLNLLPEIILLLSKVSSSTSTSTSSPSSLWRLHNEIIEIFSNIILSGTPYQIMGIIEAQGLLPFISFLHPLENNNDIDIMLNILKCITKLVKLSDTFNNREVLIGMLKSCGLIPILRIINKQGNSEIVDYCENLLKMLKDPSASTASKVVATKTITKATAATESKQDAGDDDDDEEDEEGEYEDIDDDEEDESN